MIVGLVSFCRVLFLFDVLSFLFVLLSLWRCGSSGLAVRFLRFPLVVFAVGISLIFDVNNIRRPCGQK